MILVVGSGIAGLTAALVARESGAEVVIATKGRIDDANTTHAQGGIAAVVSPMTPTRRTGRIRCARPTIRRIRMP